MTKRKLSEVMTFVLIGILIFKITNSFWYDQVLGIKSFLALINKTNTKYIINQHSAITIKDV